MSSRNLKILSLIFVVLLTVAVYPVFKKEVETVLKPEPEVISLFNQRLSFDEISSVDLQTKTSSIELRRHSDGWRIGEKEADLAKISQFITSFNDMTVGDLVSKNSENHSNLGVDEESGIHVKITAQNNNYDIIVGNAASPGTFYVRKSGEDQVYIAKGNLKTLISLTPGDWRDKVTANLALENITKIEYIGSESFNLEKNNETWSFIQGRSKRDLSEEEVSKFENLFNPLLAYNFAADEEIEKFENTALWKKIRLNFYSGKDSVLNLIIFDPSQDESGDSYLVKNATTDSDIYKVYDYRFDGLFDLLNVE